MSSSSADRKGSKKPQTSVCVKPYDAKVPKKLNKNTFIPKINIDPNMRWVQIPFDIASQKKEDILKSYEETSVSYLDIQSDLLAAWKEIEDNKQNSKAMIASNKELIKSSEHMRSVNEKLQSEFEQKHNELVASVQNAQDLHGWAKNKDIENKNLLKTNATLVTDLTAIKKCLAEKYEEIAKLHENNKTLKCSSCDAFFKEEKSLKMHSEVHEKVIYQGLVDVASPENPASEVTLESMHEIIQLPQCNICGLSFRLQSDFNVHNTNNNCEGTKPPKSDKSIQCKICKKTLPNKNSLNSHVRGVHGPKKFECGQCDKKFSINEHLKSHLTTHNKQKPFSCKNCPKEFKHKSSLNLHVKRCKSKLLLQEDMTK